MSSRVSVIIVAAGRQDYLKAGVESLKRQHYPDKEIIIIDNSCGNLADSGIPAGPEIKIYSENRNMTYCRSLNKGIEISRGDFVLCLNDDVVLEADFIDQAVKGFFLAPAIGMVSGRIMRFDKKTVDSTGLFLTVFRSASERDHGKSLPAESEKAGYIFGVSGAVAFYRRKMLDELRVGEEYFDNDFGFFYEDLDIAWRAQNAGWKGYYIPDAVAYHIRGGTARPSEGRGRRLARRYLTNELYFSLLKNRYLAMIKNDSLLKFLLSLPFIVLYDIASWGFAVMFRPQLIKMLFTEKIPFASAWEKRKIAKRVTEPSVNK